MKNLFMDKYTSHISYFWGLTCAAIGALSLNDVALIIGIILSIATFFINWAYKRRDFQHKKNLREQYYAKYDKDSDNHNL